MGQLLVAMPRTKYQGAFSSKDAHCSQLIGGSSSDDQMIATQMATRLSTKLGQAVFVSCELSTTDSSSVSSSSDEGWITGLDRDMISQRAAALAEKKVWQLLQEHKQETKS